MPAAPGRRLVALAMPPGEEFMAALHAAWQRGDAVLPLDPAAAPAAAERLLAELRPERPVDPDVALVIATSGSTGRPKGAQLTRAALEASARATHARIGLEPGDRWLSSLPWHHIGGIQVMLRARLLGIDLIVHERFDVAAVAAADASLVSLVPTQLARLLDAGVDLTRFRVVLLGGAAAPPPLLERARAAGVPLVTTYGMSETAGGCVYDGRPLDGVDVEVGDDGRIRIRGPVTMAGYRLRPDLTAQAFDGDWLVTNDLGALDPEGTLRVIGRADDVIVTGGVNVSPAEVAAVLAEHPALADVTVTGAPDPAWGQRVVAVAVVRPGASVPTGSALRSWCRDRLPPAALPRGLVVVDRLPQLPSGKLDRLAVARLAQATRASSQSATPGSCA